MMLKDFMLKFGLDDEADMYYFAERLTELTRSEFRNCMNVMSNNSDDIDRKSICAAFNLEMK